MTEQSSIDLMPNKTFFVQLVVFLLTYIAMNFLVFQPVLRLMKRRRELTLGAEQEAGELQAKTEALIHQHDEKIAQARQQGMSLKENTKKTGEAQALEILDKARTEVDGKIETTRQEIQRESKSAQLQLRQYTQGLSKDLAEKLLGRKVSG